MMARTIKSVEGLPTEDLNRLLLHPLGVRSAAIDVARERALDVFDRGGRNYKKDPFRWADERAKVHLWSKQREIIESVRDHSQTAVHSCHAIGKSFVAATTVAWWLDVHPVGEAFVVTTAPTDKQVKAVLWREINRLHTRAGLAGRTNLSEWYIGKELVAFGRKPADQDPTAFQGIHARYVLLVLDEACGIPKDLWDAGSSIVSNEHSRTLAIGNPDDPFGEFASNCHKGSGWNVIHVGYKHTPNFTGEDVSEIVKDSLISRRWVEERRKKWGQGSAIFTSKCDGQFPLEGTSGTIPYAWAIACRSLELPEDPGDVAEGGIDVGAGGDRTVLRERRGLRAGREEVFVDADPMRSVGRLVEKINEWGLTRVKVDVIGIGWALAGRLAELSSVHNVVGSQRGETTHFAEVVKVNFGAKPTEGKEKRYLNKRAEIYWEVGREFSRLRRWDLGEVDDDVIAELTVSTYEIMDSFGKIKIEPKDDIIKRLGESPDRAEALLLAFYDGYAVVTTPMAAMNVDILQNVSPLGASNGGSTGAGVRLDGATLGRVQEGMMPNVDLYGGGPMQGGRW
jgi:hypothetical protein